MAASLLKVSRNEQRSVICFLWAKRLCANANQSEMHPVYGDKCFTTPAIHVGCKKFAHGHESVDEEGLGRLVVMLFRRLMQRSLQSIFSCGLTGV